jgi:hypothetical protein
MNKTLFHLVFFLIFKHCEAMKLNNYIISIVAGGSQSGFSGDGGDAIKSKLNSAYSVFVDQFKCVYIADSLNHRIRKVHNSSRVINTIAGNGAAGNNGNFVQSLSASMNQPRAITADSSGALYIADYLNNNIRKINLNSMIEFYLTGLLNHKINLFIYKLIPFI